MTPKELLSRRTMMKTGAAGLIAATGLAANAGPANAASTTAVRRFTRDVPFPLNAYVVEGEDGVVVVDAMLTNTASRELREQVDAIGKPLRAVLLTHPHPDHYAGIGNLIAGLDVPVISLPGVNDIVRRDDAEKDTLIGGMFGQEWPTDRAFPNHTVREGETLDFGLGLRFSVLDIGPAESFHDSVFVLESATHAAFVGDLVYPFMHPYMADNANADWKMALERLRSELPADMVLHVGHGLPVTPAYMAWQATYLDRVEAALLAADWNDPEAAQAAVSEEMISFLPSEDLVFFMQLSILPNAQLLGLVE